MLVPQQEQQLLDQSLPNDGAAGDLCIPKPTPEWRLDLIVIEEVRESLGDAH